MFRPTRKPSSGVQSSKRLNIANELKMLYFNNVRIFLHAKIYNKVSVKVK